jgi:hypothetical protein
MVMSSKKARFVAKKLFFPLGLEVQKMHTCIKDSILYDREVYEDLCSCLICKHSRYKHKRERYKYKCDDEIEKGIPYKVLCGTCLYFLV